MALTDSMTTTTRQVFIIFSQLVNAWPSKRNGQVVSPSSLTIISLASLHPCFPCQEINGWQPRLFFPTVPHHGTNHVSSRLVSSRYERGTHHGTTISSCWRVLVFVIWSLKRIHIDKGAGFECNGDAAL